MLLEVVFSSVIWLVAFWLSIALPPRTVRFIDQDDRTKFRFTHELVIKFYNTSTQFQRMQHMMLKNISRAILPARWFIARDACTQLFVGGLSKDTNEPVLKEAFKEYGEIVEVKVICDWTSGKSRGHGYVRYTSESSASTALEKMHGQVLDGRHMKVSYANKG